MTLRFCTYCILLLSLVLSLNSYAQEITDSAFNAATLNVYDEPDKAIKVGERMFETSKGKPKRQIDALLLLSNAYSSKRQYEKSLEYAFRARDLSNSNRYLRSEIMVLNKIAAQYHQLGVNDKALQYLDEAEKIISQYPHKDSISMILGNNYGVRGFIYRDQLSCDIAIDYFNRALDEFRTDKDNVKMIVNMSVITYNKGNCFITLNQYDSARINFEESLLFAKKAEAKSLEAFSKKGLAEVFTLQGKHRQAINELNNAVEISKNVGDLVLNRGLYKGLADNYLALNEWSEYQNYYNKFLVTEAQTKKAERNTISISLLNHSEELKQKIEEIKSTYGIVFLGGCIIIFLLIFSIIYGQILFNKQFRLLKSKLKESKII